MEGKFYCFFFSLYRALGEINILIMIGGSGGVSGDGWIGTLTLNGAWRLWRMVNRPSLEMGSFLLDELVMRF
jgi:hypothetical protein